MTLGARPPRGARPDDFYDVPPEKHGELQNAYPVQPYAGSGGVLAYLGVRLGVRGHTEITADALTTLKRGQVAWRRLRTDARRILCNASENPTLYEYTSAPAHAHTPHDQKTGQRQGSLNASLGTWQTRVRRVLEEARIAAEAGEHDAALYWIGYATHSIQDLATQRGMTAVAKSYLEHQGHGPDENKGLLQHAEYLTTVFLGEVPSLFSKDDWSKMMAWSNGTSVDVDQGNWTFSVQAYFAKAALGHRFPEVARVELENALWCAPRRCESLIDDILKKARVP